MIRPDLRVMSARDLAQDLSTLLPCTCVRAARTRSRYPALRSRLSRPGVAQVSLLIDTGVFDDMQPSHPPGTKEPRTPLALFAAEAQREPYASS